MTDSMTGRRNIRGAARGARGRARGARGTARGPRETGRISRGTRGGSRGTRRGALGSPSQASINLLVGFTKGERSGSLNHATPLETPLHPKRPRRIRMDEVAASNEVNEETPSNELSPSPGPSAIHNSPSSSTAYPSPGPSAIHNSPSSSTAVVTCGSHSTTPRSRGLAATTPQPWQEDLFNYGSEDDSDKEDDFDAAFVPFVPRAERMLFGTDEDDDEATEVPSSMLIDETIDGKSLDFKPRDLFDFDWSSFPSPPVPPTERREVFRGRGGPTGVFRSPYEAFTSIWTPEFMQLIVVETNRYAQQLAESRIQDGTLGPSSRIRMWRDITVDQLYVYFALLIVCGVTYKSDIKEYWTKVDVSATPNFGLYMTYNTFVLISMCLHFVNNKNIDPRSMTRPQARLYKIQPVVDHLNERFQALYSLGKNIALDESLTQWKGCLSFIQYIKNKVAGVGIKTYEVCDSHTGYLWRFRVHAGREEARESQDSRLLGYIETLVLELLEGLENKGHCVWMDNFYNSPSLARVLKSLGFDCVGTLRTNRQGVPPEIKNLNVKDMAMGQITGCTSGDVDIVVWRDSNRVAMISTYHGAAVHTANGVTKPIAVHDYNVCMGGVDRKDQMLSTYMMERKRTRVWYKKLFRRLLNVSVLNSYLLHRDSEVPDNHEHLHQHRAFRRKLVEELLERHHTREFLTPIVQRGKKYILPSDVIQHFPMEYGLKPGTTRNERIRRSCVVCRRRQPFYCPVCTVPLCAGQCSRVYHSKP